MLNTPSDKLPVVLVVSDKPATKVFIRRALHSNYYVLEVSNGLEALDTLKRTKIEVVIIQDHLPYLSIQEFCMQTRTLPMSEDLSILVISGNLKKSYMKELMTAGATDFLREPLDQEDLFKRIEYASKTKQVEKKIGPLAKSIPTLALNKQRKKLGDLKVSERDKVLKEISKALETKESISLLMLDFDHIDTIKERWGKPILEDLFSLVQSHLTTKLRAQDLVFLAEEGRFLIILPKTSKTAATLIAEDIQESFKEKKFATTKGVVKLTFSIGVVALQDLAKSGQSAYDYLEGMLKTGDSYVNKAKKIGNRIVSN